MCVYVCVRLCLCIRVCVFKRLEAFCTYEFVFFVSFSRVLAYRKQSTKYLSYKVHIIFCCCSAVPTQRIVQLRSMSGLIRSVIGSH